MSDLRHPRARVFRARVLACIAVIGAVCAAPLALAQTAHYNGTLSDVVTSIAGPSGIAVDASGNVYVADNVTGNVYKETLQPDGTYVQTTVTSGLNKPSGVAVDGAGNVYVVDGPCPVPSGSPCAPFAINAVGVVHKVALNPDGVTYAAQVPVVSGLIAPRALAVDASGTNIYVSVFKYTILPANNTYISGVLQFTGSGTSYPTQTVVANTLFSNGGVAVDASGNVYFADIGSSGAVAGNIYKAVPSGVGTYTTTPIYTTSTTDLPYGVAVDASNNVYVALYSSDRLLKLPWTGSSYGAATTTTFSTTNFPILTAAQTATLPLNVAAGANGTMYVATTAGKLVAKLAPGYDFGTVAVGASSTSATLSFTIDTPGTVTDAVLTQGVSGLDFVLTPGGSNTCAATFASAGTSCQIAVTFSPKYPGLRKGSVALLDASGNLLAQTPVFGTGQAPLIAFDAASLTQVSTGGFALSGNDPAQAPQSVAVDNAGNVYVTSVRGGVVGGSAATDFILQIKPNGTVTQIAVTPPSAPFTLWVPEVAVDSYGNLVIADTGNNRMLYVTQPGQANSVTSLLNTGNVFAADAAHGNLPFNYHPFLPAVDQYNNIFFATNGNSLGTSAGGLWEVTASGVTQAVSLGGLTMNSPLGVAVDNSGNLLVADCGNNRILSITRPGQSGSTTSVLATSGITLNCPSSVTVDAAGDIYIADNGSARIIDVSISGAARVVSLKNPDHSNFYDTANPAAAAPFQVVVDGAGNLYFVNQTTTNGGTPYGGTLQKLAQGTPLPLTFVNPANAAITPATYFSTTSSDSPQTLIASNIGNALLNFAAPSPAIAPASFVLDASTTCPASGAAAYNLTSGAECNLSVNFTPQTVGAITGTLVLTDNNLNLSAQTQVLNLNGTGVALPTQTTLGSTLNPSVYGQAVTLTATVAADPATGSSAVPTGSVQFFDAISGAPVALGTATLSGGVATLPATAALIVGTHPISATYTPDTTNFAASSAVTLPQQVTPALLTVTAANQSRVFGAADPAFTYAISGFVNGDTQASVVSGTATLTASDTSTSAAGSTFPITFATQALAAANYTFTYVPGTLTISGGATQTITFTLASPVTYGVAPISLNGTASSGLAVSYTVTGPATVSGSTLTITGAGTVTVTAHQPGDANYAAAADVAQTIVVNPALLTVTANNASRVFGAADPVFAATISGYVNGDTSSVVSGAPSFTSTDTPTSPVSPPTYSIVPAQGTLGAANYTFSFANGTLTIVGGATASIALTSSPSTSTFGQSVTFTATVSAATGTPSGSVSFYDQGVLIGSGVLVNGVATLTTSTLAVGTHPITAIYGGDATFAPVTSAVLNQVVGAAAVGMALVSSLNPSASGQAVTFTATLSSASANALAPHQHAALGADGAATLVASALPTGAVNFFDNGVAIGSGTLNAGVATLTTSALAVGAHPITATYAGDKSNGPASAALNQVVNNAVVPPPVAVAAPALNAWALLLLTLTLGALGFVRMRRE